MNKIQPALDRIHRQLPSQDRKLSSEAYIKKRTTEIIQSIQGDTFEEKILYVVSSALSKIARDMNQHTHPGLSIPEVNETYDCRFYDRMLRHKVLIPWFLGDEEHIDKKMSAGRINLEGTHIPSQGRAFLWRTHLESEPYTSFLGIIAGVTDHVLQKESFDLGEDMKHDMIFRLFMLNRNITDESGEMKKNLQLSFAKILMKTLESGADTIRNNRIAKR